MTDRVSKVFAPSKVNIDQDKLQAYLNGERVYPTTIEMDLTQKCSRACGGCPYGVSRKAGLTLEMPFIERLFSVLGPHTPGIVLSGGEPTIVPHFGETVAMARAKGFTEIAVISNGANIGVPAVQDALMEHVTSIRISLYDWQEGDSDSFVETLAKIEGLCRRIRQTGSRLEVGAAMLTRSQWSHRFEAVGLRALETGINWLYFHPYCIDWEKKNPVQADQSGVIEAIERLKEKAPADASIQVPYARYGGEPLRFEKLHGTHFLIQVGADGINYAGPEAKYEQDFALLDLNEYLEEDFLWHPERLERLERMSSENYRFIGTKHRPPVFSDYIQKIIDLGRDSEQAMRLREPSSAFSYPSII